MWLGVFCHWMLVNYYMLRNEDLTAKHNRVSLINWLMAIILIVFQILVISVLLIAGTGGLIQGISTGISMLNR